MVLPGPTAGTLNMGLLAHPCLISAESDAPCHSYRAKVKRSQGILLTVERKKKNNAHGRTPRSVAMPKLLLSFEFRAGEMAQERAEGTPSPQRSRNWNQGGGRAQMASPGEQSCAEGRTLLSCGCLRWSPRHSCPRSV